MEWYEIIHIRLFDPKDKEEAMSVFSQLDLPKLNIGIKAIKLLQDVFLDNDLRILIHWQDGRNGNAKSAFGIHLVSALNKFGRIHHIVCKEILYKIGVIRDNKSNLTPEDGSYKTKLVG